jgi:hypothetical protein
VIFCSQETLPNPIARLPRVLIHILDGYFMAAISWLCIGPCQYHGNGGMFSDFESAGG